MDRVIEFTLDGIAHGGEALGRHEGKVVFVPYAIPGERVRAEIVEEKERWARARLIEVLVASPDRVTAPCPYFGPGLCGGCQWQHIEYERQANFKAEIVADQLRRLGHIVDPPVNDTLVLADEHGYLSYDYRNQTRFRITEDGQVGYRRAGTAGGQEIIAIDRCLLLDERLDELHDALDLTWSDLEAITLRTGIHTDQSLVLFEAAGREQPELDVELPVSCAVLTVEGVQPLIGQPWIEEEVADRRYRISAESPFPANTIGAAALVDVVRAYLDPQPDDVLLDLHCGVGLFALALADAVREVIGVEVSPSAVEDLAYNGRDQVNLTVHEGPVPEVLPALAAQAQQVDLVIMEPPRTGAGRDVIAGLAALDPRRIVYVAGDPATVARDAVFFTEFGYTLLEVQPVDMLPQSFQVETVVLMSRKSTTE